MNKPKDKVGTEIVVGDCLIYGHAIGRSAGLRIGKVLSIKKREKKYESDSGFSISVVGVDDDWQHKEPKLCKPGTLLYPNRTIVISDCSVPGYAFDLLASYARDPK